MNEAWKGKEKEIKRRRKRNTRYLEAPNQLIVDPFPHGRKSSREWGTKSEYNSCEH